MGDYLDFLGNLRNTHRDDGEAEPEQASEDGSSEQESKTEDGSRRRVIIYDPDSEPEDSGSRVIIPDPDSEPEEQVSEQPESDGTRSFIPPRKRHIRTRKVVTTGKNGQPDEADVTQADKYTDRFEAGETPPEKPDGKTRRMSTYSDIRTSGAQSQGKTRHISVDDFRSDTAQQESQTEEELTGDDEDRAARLRAIALSAQDDYEGEQLVMPGFADKKEDERTPEEVELDEKLKAVRKDRISKFKLTRPHNSGGTLSGEHTAEMMVPGFLKTIAAAFEKYNTDFSPCEGDEFTDLTQRRRIFTGLVKVRRKNLIRIIIVSALGVILLLTNCIAAATASPAGALTVFGGNAAVYTAFNLVLFLVVCGICADEVKKGVLSILQIHPKAQGAAVLLSIAVIAQCVGAFITKKSLADEVQLFTGAAALLYVPLLYSKVFCYDNARHCFKAISSGNDKSVVRSSTPGDGITELVNDRDKSYSVVFEGKTQFITHFLERASRSAYAAMPSSRLVLGCFLASIILGIVSSIISKSPVTGLSAFAGCMCLTFPVSGLFASTMHISKRNSRLSHGGCYVQSFADARDLANSDYIVIDAHELFDVSLRDVTAFSGLTETQAASCAAALAMNSGGTLEQAFSKKFGAYRDKLPEAQELSYEEKLGLSAWVSNCRMLLGTRQLLENHNVKLPGKELSEAFTESGTHSLYMSIEEKLAAMVSIDYSCDEALAEKLRILASSGMSIIILTCDANITEHMVESKLNLPENTVKVVSSLAYEEFESAKSEVSPGENTGIVFNGGIRGLCDCAVTACSFDRLKRLSKIICAGGCAAGVIIGAMISLSGALGVMSSLHVMILQGIMLLITTLLCGLSDSLTLPHRKRKEPETVKEEPPEQEAPAEPEKPQRKGGFTGDIFGGLLGSEDERTDVFPEL